MGAAQNQSIQLTLIGIQKTVQQRLGFRTFCFSGFDQLHQTGSGYFFHTAIRKTVQQLVKFFLPQGYLGGHHADAPTGEPVCRQLQRRLDAHYDEIGIFPAEDLNGGGSGGIAGDHQRLYGILLRQMPGGSKGKPAHILRRTAAIGGVGAIAIIHIPLPGHTAVQMPQHADAAYTGVENRDIILFRFHKRSPAIR